VAGRAFRGAVAVARPRVTGAAVITLAFGSGLTTAGASVIDAGALRAE
jgi:hypothetical protein